MLREKYLTICQVKYKAAREVVPLLWHGSAKHVEVRGGAQVV